MGPAGTELVLPWGLPSWAELALKHPLKVEPDAFGVLPGEAVQEGGTGVTIARQKS